MITKELKNKAENLYDSQKKNDKYISYGYVSNQLREKASRLIDNFQLGLMDKDINGKDLTDLLRINNRFKGLALEKPEERIIPTDLAEVNYFLHIIKKYNQ